MAGESDSSSEDGGELVRLFERDLELRAEDARLRHEEIKQGRHEVDTQYDLSCKSIEAQLEYTRINHESARIWRRHRFIISLVALLVAAVLFGIALALGHAEIVKELVVLAGVAVSSGVGGYSYGLNKGKRERDDQS